LEPIKTISTSIDIHPERIILLAGAGQNVGKTTYACQIIQHLKSLGEKLYSIKISPHFHQENPPKTLFSDERFVLSLEDKKDSGKDSSRMLESGANESFFLQTNDEFLEEAFQYTMSFIPQDIWVVVEAGGLRELIKPALFFFVERADDGAMKEYAAKNRLLADRVISFDGKSFNCSPKNIQIIDGCIQLIV